MTREELMEVLTILKEQARNSGTNTFVWDINIDSFKFVIDSAIKALEQEPTTKNLAADREDAVERLNAIKQLIGYDKDSEIVKATQKSLDMAINALEQEPILGKIRAEIEQLSTSTCTETRKIYINADDFKENVLAILDKYKAETEKK